MQKEPSLLPYRTVFKDEFNKTYAYEIKKSFKLLPFELRVEFQKFTHNLMREEYISRFCLLEATRDFYKYFHDLCDGTYTWIKFTEGGTPP